MLVPDTLVWEDTFEGDSLDRSRWEPEVNAFGGGNHEEQIYTDYPRNVRVEGGKLILEAHREETGIQGTFRPWSSGRVRTKHRGDWTYGRFEASIKMPKGQGFWPAFWMLPTDEDFGVWPLSGEIDIMEYVGHEPRCASAAVHFGQLWPRNKYLAQVPTITLPEGDPDFSEEFHTFTLVWQPDRLVWFVDGGKVFEVTMAELQKNGGNPNAFQHRFHIILNLAVGGKLPGATDKTTPSPARMEVDWVRVYQ